MRPKEFNRTGRAGLIVLAALGLIGVNGVLPYGDFFGPGASGPQHDYGLHPQSSTAGGAA